jgi:hypothetical protein
MQDGSKQWSLLRRCAVSVWIEFPTPSNPDDDDKENLRNVQNSFHTDINGYTRTRHCVQPPWQLQLHIITTSVSRNVRNNLNDVWPQCLSKQRLKLRFKRPYLSRQSSQMFLSIWETRLNLKTPVGINGVWYAVFHRRENLKFLWPTYRIITRSKNVSPNTDERKKMKKKERNRERDMRWTQKETYSVFSFAGNVNGPPCSPDPFETLHQTQLSFVVL